MDIEIPLPSPKSNFVLELTHEETLHIIELAKQIRASPSETPDAFCQQCKEAAGQLPVRIGYRLLQFREYGSHTGYLLVKIPIKDKEEGAMDIPMTPPDNTEKRGETTILAKIQAILMESFCEMVAYEAEGYGRLFQDVVPTQSMAEQQTSLGSRKELEIHTEQAFSELRPDFISLACLRGDSHALTYVLPVTKIVEAMDSEDIALLRQPLWNTGVDLSFKLGGYEFIEGDIRGPMPILTGSSDDPRLRFDQDLMFGLEERAHGLVGKIVDIYYQSRYEHCLLPGEIMWVDNRRAVHGRSPFFPRYDGKDRFLVRCFGVVGDLKDMTLGMGFDDGRRCIPAIYS